MRSFWNIFLVSFLCFACSFKNNDHSKAPSPAKSEALSLSLKIDETLHGEMRLNEVKALSQMELSGENFSLPYLVPDEMVLTLSNIPDSSIHEGGIRAFIKYMESEAELPLSAVKVVAGLTPDLKSNLNLEFHVHGLKNIFTPSESRTASVRIQINGQKEKEARVLKFSLSTPPSRIESKSLTPEEFSSLSKESESLSFSEIKLVDKRFALLRVLQITSFEENPVEIVLGQRGLGLIQTKIYERVYRDLGCNFAVDEQHLNFENPGPFELIPLNEESLQFAMDRVHLGEGFPKELTFHLRPQTPLYVGLYGSDPNTLSLFDQGRPQDTMRTFRGATTCHEECAREEEKCRNRTGRGIDGMPDIICHTVCAEKKLVRDQGDILTGRQLESLKFIVSESGLNLKAQNIKAPSMTIVDQRALPLFSHFDLMGIWTPKTSK
ncbi:MAG: hypothetical protein IPL83_07435 [Bdellovibrionales bacterium]|nr:hypothetical protein [Bdellovibrionales bacterium]